MKGKKIFWGLFFVLAGALVIVNQMGLFTEIGFCSLFFTIFLAAILIKSLASISFTGILFSLAGLCIIYSETLGITDLTPWPVLLAALFGSIGLHCIFGSHHKHRHEREFESESIDSDNVVDVNVSFGASAKYVNTKELEKINVSCSFGAVKLYLDNAELKNDSAIIDLNMSFAGAEIYVPKDWKVQNNVDTSLGGIDEKNSNSKSSNKTIILTGKISLSGIEIIYV